MTVVGALVGLVMWRVAYEYAQTEGRQLTLQPLCTFELAQIAVECANREMAVLSRNLQDEIVREPNRGPFAKAL